ncbi:MAG: DnaA regulatory inactivator Hda [Gammaproteobacteria bacterium]
MRISVTYQRQLTLAFPEGRIPSLELYYPGPNREVLERVRRLGEKPASLYLWGPSGTGKTHLLQAAGHDFTALGRRACYLALAQSAELSPMVLEGLEDLDLVCIDELHTIAGNPEWERALLHLYERLRDFGRCFVVASRESPGFISIDLPDLKSRLAWGLVFHLRQLDECDKVRALQWRAKLRGADLPEGVAKYLLRRNSRAMAELCRVLDELDESSLAMQRRLTLPLMRAVLDRR